MTWKKFLKVLVTMKEDRYVSVFKFLSVKNYGFCFFSVYVLYGLHSGWSVKECLNKNN